MKIIVYCFGFFYLLSLVYSYNLCAQNVFYEYDNSNRIINAEYSDNTKIQYSYDQNGNLVGKIITNGCFDSQEPNNSVSTAYNLFSNPLGSLLRDTIINSYINPGTDQDWYKINNDGVNGRLFITLSNLPADYNIELYDSTGLCESCYIGGSLREGLSDENITYNFNASYGHHPPFYLKVFPSNSSQFSQCSPYQIQVQWKSGIFMNVQSLIEGFYRGNGTMAATIDPVNYPNVCDTVCLEIHNSISPYSFMYSDTSTISIDGISNFILPLNLLGNNYYIVFRHRSSIETWSKFPINFNSNSIEFNFKEY